MGIDATRKWASEGFTRPWPDEIIMDSKTKARVDSKSGKRWQKELGDGVIQRTCWKLRYPFKPSLSALRGLVPPHLQHRQARILGKSLASVAERSHR